ncbi:MAG: glutathione peroxidase [Planctomycetota bacterium]
MLKKLLPASLLSLLGFATGCSNPAPQDATTMERWKDVSFFDLDTATLAGKPQKLADFEGKVVLVVNTASKCGLTPQYAKLQELYEKYAERGLVVLGFPCNQFMGQEPGSADEIAQFCQANYGVTFPMMQKVDVKAGDGQSPIYGLLGTRTGELPDWNFAKYLVSRDGSKITFFGARTDPTGDELTKAIEALL